MDELVFAPWLSGERVPVFDDRVRGAFVGLSLRHGRGHLLRALMEGVAFQMRWALEYGAAFGTPIGEVRGVGGGFIGTTWTQIIADVLDRPVASIRQPQDAAALGAAACALVGIGAQPDLRFVRDIVAVERTYVPDASRRQRLDAGFDRFRRLYDALAPLFAAGEAGPADPESRAGSRSGALRDVGSSESGAALESGSAPSAPGALRDRATRLEVAAEPAAAPGVAAS